MQPTSRPRTFYFVELKIGTPVTSGLDNVHTNVGFSTFFSVRSSYATDRRTDGRTDEHERNAAY